MLKILNNLAPFFDDCYRRISVREYAKLTGISPPTASKLLISYHKEGLLVKEEDRNYLFFQVNRESKLMKGLSRVYWNEKLKDLINVIEEELFPDALVLFGSLSKLETKKESDIDILVITKSKKKINLERFEILLDS